MRCLIRQSSPARQALSRHLSAGSSPAADSNMCLMQQVQHSALATHRRPPTLFLPHRQFNFWQLLLLPDCTERGGSK